MARSLLTDKGMPGTWKKFFQGSFSEPGIGGQDTSVLSAGQDRGDAIFPNVTYSSDLNKYVMVLNMNYYREQKPEKSGIYITFSDDGIRWSKPAQLIRNFSIARIDREVAWHPTLFNGWLYYSYSPRWGHRDGRKPHYFVGQPLVISSRGNE